MKCAFRGVNIRALKIDTIGRNMSVILHPDMEHWRWLQNDQFTRSDSEKIRANLFLIITTIAYRGYWYRTSMEYYDILIIEAGETRATFPVLRQPFG